MRTFKNLSNFIAIAILLPVALLFAEEVNTKFHNAPDSVKTAKNPYDGADSRQAGKLLYTRNCLSCHGKQGKGTGNVPSLVDGKLDSVTPGEVFWFITKGSKDNGMPSWSFLQVKQRWQIVNYVKSMKSAGTSAEVTAPAADLSTSKLKAAPPTPPFTDFRIEKPGTVRKITVKDLPEPYATKSANNGPDLVGRPDNVWPVAPAGFKVEMFASGLDNPRTLRTAPNGDIFLAEVESGRIRVFRGMTSDGKPEQAAIFASGLKRPYGLAFYPPGPDPQWLYVGSETELVRLPYHNGDLKAGGEPQSVIALPGPGGHGTRAVEFSQEKNVCRGGLGIERRRSRYDPEGEESSRHFGVRSGELQFERVRLGHSQCGWGACGESEDGRVVVLGE
jgi:mono/diheme cytochrome c family protein